MHRIILPLLLFSALLSAIEYQEARHLLSRTGFGGSPEEIERLLPLSYQQAVDYLVDGMMPIALTPAPAWTAESSRLRKQRRKFFRSLGQKQKRAYRMVARRQWRKRALELQGWWYREMISTPSPLTERMTLFWHNHFTSSLKKVKAPLLLYRQNALLRRYAGGNFRHLLHAVAQDPAMIFYLDNQTNRKGKPNENFARELLELFTLGEGQYQERDIKEAARAFTGWMANRNSGEFHFHPRLHDYGVKEFMGHKGKLGGSEILDIVLENPHVAEFIVEKLWREFISETPVATEVKRLAALFRQHDYEMAPLLKALFTSSYFRDPSIYGTQIKSPVELIVGTVRMFQIPIHDTRQLVQYGRQLGQDILNPPNVKGWPGGKAWITTNTLLLRRQLLQRSLRGMDAFISRFWVWHYLKDEDSTETSMPGLEAWLTLTEPRKHKKIARILLPIDPILPLPEGVDTATVIRHIVLDLTYQLK